MLVSSRRVTLGWQVHASQADVLHVLFEMWDVQQDREGRVVHRDVANLLGRFGGHDLHVT